MVTGHASQRGRCASLCVGDCRAESGMAEGIGDFTYLQLIMVIALIMYPDLVMHSKSEEASSFNSVNDLSNVGGQAASADEAIRLMQEIAKEQQSK